MDAIKKYMQTPEAKKKSSQAKDRAWTQFVNQIPKADISQFVSQVSIDEDNNFSAEVFFKAGPDLQSVFGSDRQYWSNQMKAALGLDSSYGFPYELSPLKTESQLPIPAVDFTEPAPSVAKNIQQRKQNLRNSRRIFHHKIS